MESMKRATKFLIIDLKQSILWFWGVVLLLNIISYSLMSIYGFTFFGISSQIRNGTTSSLTMTTVAAGNLMPIIIYFIAYSYEMYYQNYRIALGFSITRKDFYKSLILRNISTALIFALIQSTLMKLDIYIVSKLGATPKVEYEIFNTSIDNIIFIMISLLLIFLTITSIFNLIVALNYKFGFKLWIFLGFVIFLTTSFMGPYIFEMFDGLFTTRISTLHLITLGGIMIFSYLLGYLIIINTNIKNKIS